MGVIATVRREDVRPLDNPRYEAFAQAIARGETTAQAALSAGYSAHTAGTQGRRLKSDTRIATRILAIKTEIVAEMQRSVAPAVLQATKFVRQQVQERAYRLSIAQDIVDRCRALIDARAKAFVESGEVYPGGETGLLARSEKVIGSGPNSRHVVEYAVDRSVLAELGTYLDRAAIECGDRDEKQHLGSGLSAEHVDLKDKSLSEMEAERAILLDAKAKIEALRSGKPQAPLVIEAQAQTSGAEVEIPNDVSAVAVGTPEQGADRLG